MTVHGYIPDEADLDYIDDVSPAVHPVLASIETDAAERAWPIADRQAARLLSVLAVGRRRILEIGTGYGYATLWLAFGQGGAGTITTIDVDEERIAYARRRWREASIADDRIAVVRRPALDALADESERALAGPFDLVFLDGPKPEYVLYLDAVVPRLARGALIVADDVLHDGAVARVDAAAPDLLNAGIRAFNATIACDSRFAAALLPLGRGLVVAAFLL